MLVHGYTIEAACDGKNCPNAGTYYTQDSFYGQNKRLAFAEMRAAGWTWSGYNCLCPKCSKKTPDRRGRGQFNWEVPSGPMAVLNSSY